jgi:hypothetical protein
MLSSTRGALNRIAAANRLTEMVLPTAVFACLSALFVSAMLLIKFLKQNSHRLGVEIRISCDRFFHPLACNRRWWSR